MFDIFIIKYHEHQSYCHTVVRSQRSSVGGKNSVLYNQVDSVFFKVVLYSRDLFAYHIKVALKHNCRLIFRSFASAFFYNYIISLILMNPQAPVFCKFYQIVADSLFISRASGNRADLLKKVK